jgi:fructokinase
MNNKPVWGIDLGGTKIEGAVLKSAEEPEVICRTRIVTEAEKGYDHILRQISKLIEIIKNDTGIHPERIGIGTPGTLDPQTGLLINSNSTDLNNKPFKKDLETTLQMPVNMANDANCFALAETKMGIVQDVYPAAEVVFGVIMGTGVGGGLIVNGKIINGHMGNAGEWGHNFLDSSGGKCYCGKTGCVETVISGPALQKYYTGISGEQATLKEIYKKNKNEEPHAVETIQRLIHFFGLGISTIINMIDPAVVVIGGGVGNIPELYTKGVEEVNGYTFNTRFNTHIVAPKLGDSAGVFGAAFLK